MLCLFAAVGRGSKLDDTYILCTHVHKYVHMYVWRNVVFYVVTPPSVCIQLFQEFPEMMKSASAKKAIKGYNKLAAVFVEYEMLYHQAWVAEVCTYI